MKRLGSVDTIRFLSVIAVIAIHTSPFNFQEVELRQKYYYLDVFINQIARFGVPFFFLISGYFFGLKVNNGGEPLSVAMKSSKKIIVLFLLWSLIYLTPYNIMGFVEFGIFGPLKISYWRLLGLVSEPLDFLFQGSKVHLWFLVSLIMITLLSGIFLKYNKTKTLIILAVVLYVFGVLAKAYSATPVGIELNFNTRNGPFFGLIFFVTGIYLSSKTPKISWFKYGVSLFCMGTFLHFLEIYLLMKGYGTPLKQDFVFGTYLMGVGISYIALSKHAMLSLKRTAKLGTFTLGIYASHFIYVDILLSIDKKITNPLWEVAFVIIVLFLSIGTVLLLSKFHKTRQLVV